MNYGKWQTPESAEEAFEKVKSGAWDFERFNEWMSHLICTEVRDATANESM